MIWRHVAAASLLVCIQPAVAQERCVATHYRLPPNIADAMRPYLLCGLIRERSDTGTLVNGVRVFMHGQNLEGCSDVRASAFATAYERLAATLPDPAARQAYLNAELRKADTFLITATNLDDLGIGEEPNTPTCRTRDAQD